MKTKDKLKLLIAVSFLALSAIACGDSNDGRQLKGPDGTSCKADMTGFSTVITCPTPQR